MRQGLGKSARWRRSVQESTGWTLKNSKDGDTTVSLSNVFHCLSMVKMFFLMFSQNPLLAINSTVSCSPAMCLHEDPGCILVTSF